MDLPIKFPRERDKIYQESLAFRRLSPDERFQAILEVIALGAAMMNESPHREAMLRLQQAHEEAWKKAQKELFARHGMGKNHFLKMDTPKWRVTHARWSRSSTQNACFALTAATLFFAAGLLRLDSPSRGEYRTRSLRRGG